MKFDYSKFKKIHTDARTTTLQHPDGHQIKVAHQYLKPEMRQALQKMPLMMADGGTVDDQSQQQQQQPASPQTPAININIGGQPAAGQASPDVNSMLQPNLNATAQDFSKMPGGRPMGLLTSPTKALSDEQWTALSPEDRTNYLYPGAVKTSSGLDSLKQAAGDISQSADANRAQAIQAAGGAMPADIQAPQAMQQQPGMDIQHASLDQSSAPASAGMPGSQPSGAGGSTSDPYGIETYNNTMMKGISEQKQGVLQEASVQDKLGQQLAGIEATAQTAATDRQSKYQGQFDALDKERQAFMKDIQDGHIDPNHYLHSKTTGGKIATAIGLMLGGMGAGMQGKGGNPVLDFINSQIDRDIKSQAAEIGKKQDLLSANFKAFGNLRDAVDMTRVMYNDMLSHQLKGAAEGQSGALAQAKAQQTLGQIDQQSAQTLSQIAMRRTLLGGGNNGAGNNIDPAMKIRALLPEAQQKEAFEQLKDAQILARSRDLALSAFDQISKINTVGNRITSPIQSKRQIDAIKGPVIASLSKMTAGRFTEQDAHLLDDAFTQMLDNPKTMDLQRRRLTQLLDEKNSFPALIPLGINPSGGSRYDQGGQKKFQLAPPQQGK